MGLLQEYAERAGLTPYETRLAVKELLKELTPKRMLRMPRPATRVAGVYWCGSCGVVRPLWNSQCDACRHYHRYRVRLEAGQYNTKKRRKPTRITECRTEAEKEELREQWRRKSERKKQRRLPDSTIPEAETTA